jgi:hypothetical protein
MCESGRSDDLLIPVPFLRCLEGIPMTNLRTITVTKKNGSTKSVESPYTDDAIVTRLRKLAYADPAGHVALNDSSVKFGRSLVEKAEKYDPSSAQLAWMHILVVETECPVKKEKPKSKGILATIRALIDLGAEKLQYPKVRLQTASGQRVKMQRAGNGSKNPGRINITDGEPYPGNQWFGFITLDGEFVPSNSAPQEVIDAIIAFDGDPRATAQGYGTHTGNCCFCGKELTDPKSVAVGYGSTCAGHFGLPYGTAKDAEAWSKTIIIEGSDGTVETEEGDINAFGVDGS